jgi:small-conductance mechanosensitive channel/CRP-like cAMP-binding protein
MTDLISVAETIARDPLLSAFALMTVGVLVSRLLLRQRPIWRAFARVVFLVLLTLLLLHNDIVPYLPQHLSGTPLRDVIAGILKIAWWFWAAWFLVALIRSIVVFERRQHEAKLIQDLLSGLIYLAAAFAVIAYVFDLPVQGLLATSGVIAIVLGLALQSTLNDVFSGLVLSLSSPYRPGDWINIEGGTEGQVIEMNWRATHVLTSRRDLAIVPNSTIAKSKILNVSFPSSIHGITVAVQLGSRTPPASGTNILELAVLNCRSILAVPRPTVRVMSIDAAQTGYELTFFIEQLGSATEAQNELFDLIFRHATAAGVQLAAPKNGPYPAYSEETRTTEKTGPEIVLDLAAIFAALIPTERAEIAAKLKRISYEKGDTLVEPGTVLQSLFVVGSGVLSVTRRDSGGETELLRFGPGDTFGEISLLTGASCGASVTALSHATVYELAKKDLAPILEARPQVAHELSRALAQQQAAGRALPTAELGKTEAKGRLSAWFSERIHKLFELEKEERKNIDKA